MTLRLTRRVAILLIGLLVFAQASVALAACTLDRGSLSQLMAASSEMPCTDCDASMSDSGPLYANRCVAHCTADLQLAGMQAALGRSPADVPALLVPRTELRAGLTRGLEAPPPGTPPRRILLHSFLI